MQVFCHVAEWYVQYQRINSDPENYRSVWQQIVGITQKKEITGEKFEDTFTKRVIIGGRSEDRQHNDQKKQDKEWYIKHHKKLKMK